MRSACDISAWPRLISGAWPGHRGLPDPTARRLSRRPGPPPRAGTGAMRQGKRARACRYTAVSGPRPSTSRWPSRSRCVNIVLLADSSSKGSLMGLLDTLKGLVGRHKGQADEGADKFANRAKQEAGGTSPRLSDVDSEEESEINIEKDSHS